MFTLYRHPELVSGSPHCHPRPDSSHSSSSSRKRLQPRGFPTRREALRHWGSRQKNKQKHFLSNLDSRLVPNTRKVFGSGMTEGFILSLIS